MDVPLSDERDHHGAERVEESKGDGHDDAVHKQQIHGRPRRRRAVRVPRPKGAIPLSVAIRPVPAVRGPAPRDKRINVLRQLRITKVHPELVPPLMLRNPRLHVLRLKRTPLHPRCNPRRRTSLKVHLAPVPALAVEARNIGRHYPPLDARARQELEARVGLRLGSRVARPAAGADGDVARAVRVEDEDV